MNKANLAVFEEVLAPDCVRHCQATPPPKQEIRGVDQMKDFLREHFVAFPDWHEEIELMLAEGDKVACVTMGTGTQTGQMGPFPRSGKKVEVVSIIVHRLERTKIAETWISWDNVAVLTQLGHLAPPV